MKRELFILLVCLAVFGLVLYPPTISTAKKHKAIESSVIDTAQINVLQSKIDSAKLNLKAAKNKIEKQKKIILHIKKNYYIDCSGC